MVWDNIIFINILYMGAGIMFLNVTESIGIVMGNLSQYTTGSLVVSIILLTIVLLAICIMFGIQLEWTVIIILPLLLACMSYYKDFWGFGAMALVYLATIFTLNWLFK